MEDLGFKTEFILCMLELCFERNLNHPREITKIASGLKECSINNLTEMETISALLLIIGLLLLTVLILR